MNRRRADVVVSLLVLAVLVVGGALTVQAYQQQRALSAMGSMMGSSMGAVHGTDPVWYVVGTLLVSVVIGVLYLTVRDTLDVSSGKDQFPKIQAGSVDYEPDGRAADESSTRVRNPEEHPRERVLDLLPEDERRILEPVLDSPGITQIELRDRSDFSKSKVSQTVSELEKRGLLYRERQGRTYRIYPSDSLSLDE
ncbi:helix-turn-helix transcriptional regulator [Salinigranum halophilum]|uniref:helix-turn-helix transcriptional regulator n=1 Tax=Salinigranum halophilum TaxID=2565931 RepID=UPI0010A7BE53|nr:MarR family transcriptional regulator [Salinigranum halophilum]